jgi:hypothetical protein
VDSTKYTKSMDEKKGNEGDYLKERVGNDLHGQI